LTGGRMIRVEKAVQEDETLPRPGRTDRSPHY
jgi:hypothetical protein